MSRAIIELFWNYILATSISSISAERTVIVSWYRALLTASFSKKQLNAIKSYVNFGTPYIYTLWRVIISKHANYVDGGEGLIERGEKLVTQGSLASLADSLASTSAKLDPENLKIVSPTPAEWRHRRNCRRRVVERGVRGAVVSSSSSFLPSFLPSFFPLLSSPLPISRLVSVRPAKRGWNTKLTAKFLTKFGGRLCTCSHHTDHHHPSPSSSLSCWFFSTGRLLLLLSSPSPSLSPMKLIRITRRAEGKRRGEGDSKTNRLIRSFTGYKLFIAFLSTRKMIDRFRSTRRERERERERESEMKRNRKLFTSSSTEENERLIVRDRRVYFFFN